MSHTVNSIKIPPESTGPDIGVEKRTTVAFDQETNVLFVGDVVTGATSGANGTVTGITRDGYAANAGLLYLEDVSGTFQDNENLQVSAVTHAVADFADQAAVEYTYQKNVISDPNNPSNMMSVDESGIAFVRFKDGQAALGPFGALQTGEAQIVKDYRFAYEAQDNMFWDQEVTSGTVSYESNPGVILLTTTTASGSKASRTSNFYHPYVPGIGSIVELTAQVGDAGKANVRRRWGYFDNNDGLFFQLNGTALSVVKRSSTSGSPVDTVIAQADWNQDKLDGTGKSSLVLDVTKANIYYIDFQWLGAGRVRFGVILPDGSKQVIHQLEHANDANLPYMRTATLPIRIEQENTGVAASTSEFRWACAVVKHETKFNIIGERVSAEITPSLLQVSDGEKYIGSFRPTTTINSRTNRSISRFIAMTLLNANNAGFVRYMVYATNSTNISGSPSYSAVVTNSGIELDTAGTGFSNSALAKPIGGFYVAPNEAKFIQNLVDDTVHDVELYLGADGTTQSCLAVTAENIGSANTEAGVIVNWMEIKD